MPHAAAIIAATPKAVSKAAFASTGSTVLKGGIIVKGEVADGRTRARLGGTPDQPAPSLPGPLRQLVRGSYTPEQRARADRGPWRSATRTLVLDPVAPPLPHLHVPPKPPPPNGKRSQRRAPSKRPERIAPLHAPGIAVERAKNAKRKRDRDGEDEGADEPPIAQRARHASPVPPGAEDEPMLDATAPEPEPVASSSAARAVTTTAQPEDAVEDIDSDAEADAPVARPVSDAARRSLGADIAEFGEDRRAQAISTSTPLALDQPASAEGQDDDEPDEQDEPDEPADSEESQDETEGRVVASGP